MTDASPFAVSAHEYAHSWFGEDLRFANEAEWLSEAVPEALERRLYPFHGMGAADSVHAVRWTIEKTMNPAERIDADLPFWSRPSAAPYLLGAYTLVQAQFLSGPTAADQADFWAAITSWHASFPANAEATAESTLLGSSMTTFTEVPYVLAGWRRGTPAIAAFNEFPSAAGVTAATVGVAGTSQTFTLSANTAAGPVMPATLRLHHSYRLLASSTYVATTYNDTPSEQIVCGGAMTGPCGAVDGDGDGWTDPTDCAARRESLHRRNP